MAVYQKVELMYVLPEWSANAHGGVGPMLNDSHGVPDTEAAG